MSAFFHVALKLMLIFGLRASRAFALTPERYRSAIYHRECEHVRTAWAKPIKSHQSPILIDEATHINPTGENVFSREQI